jgi:hypothetical protein
MKLTRVIEGHPAASKTSAPKHQEEAMSRTIACSLRMIGFVAILAAPVAWAQEAPPIRVRGTIEGIIDSAVYVVKTRDGAELKVTLSEKPQIAGIVKASLSDIKEGSFVGELQRRSGRLWCYSLGGWLNNKISLLVGT